MKRAGINPSSNNVQIGSIWKSFQPTLEHLRACLNAVLETNWQEWEVPQRLAPDQIGISVSSLPCGPFLRENGWPSESSEIHAEWWRNRIACQKAIDTLDTSE